MEIGNLFWNDSYPFLFRLIKKYKLKRGAEIGVSAGGHCEVILKNTKVELLYGVDNYLHRESYHDVLNVSQEKFESLYQYTVKRLSVFGERFQMVRESSVDAAQKIKCDLDFVYIDAEHTYESVANDLQTWYPKVRFGGIISGHDYGHSDFPGVKRAVDQFFDPLNYQIHTEKDGVWWVYKADKNHHEKDTWLHKLFGVK